MPLSEEEMRLLEQMERALTEEDPKFVSTLRGTSLRRAARRRVALSAAGLVSGVALLFAGAVTQVWVIGILGFVVMLASSVLMLHALRGRQAVTGVPQPPAPGARPAGLTLVKGGAAPRRPRRTSSQGSFMERLEERWRRRRDQNGF